MISVGHRFDLLAISFHKYSLAALDMSPQEQLEALEAINGYATRNEFPVPSAVVKAVKACTAATAKIFCDAMDLPPKHPWMKLSQGYAILTSGEVWSKLVELNPSIQRAIDLWCYGGAKAAA